MGDTVTTQLLSSGTNKKVLKFTNISDGTGEADVVKVNVDDANTCNWPTGTLCKINQIWMISNLKWKLEWEATSDVLIMTSGSYCCNYLDFRSFGGLRNNAGAGVTGDISITTTGVNLRTYTIIMEVERDSF